MYAIRSYYEPLGVADHVGQPRDEIPDDGVTVVVAESVLGLPEAFEGQDQEGERLPALPGLGESRSQAKLHERPVRQARA